jgi:hypothetical protein|tara:strand:- start:109 stop:381 length:273 start_codon:yes stop_codon:yes gene_type:complete
MNLPFNQFKQSGSIIRVFNENIIETELIWHQDREDRTIKVIEANGWGYQLDNQLPLPLEDGQELFIPKMMYHRVIKGNGSLVVEVWMNEP